VTETDQAVRTPRVPAARAAPALSAARLAELLQLLKGAQSVELKLSVPDAGLRSAAVSLGMDPLDAELRQVCFFDTPDLDLNRRGLVVRARRVQRKPGDAVVKLRPVDPAALPAGVPSPAEGLGIEVDAMPGGFVCSGTLKRRVDNADVQAVVSGDRPLSSLFSRGQREFIVRHSTREVGLDDLTVLGPILVLKLRYEPERLRRQLVVELWTYPDGSHVLELSTKCRPEEAFQVAAESRVFLSRQGVDLSGEQQTKTLKALKFFAARAAEAASS